MKLGRMMFLALTACLATATVVSACGDKAAKTTQAKSECSKTATATVAGVDTTHCSKTKAAQAALASNEGGCSKTKAAQAALASNEGGCSKTKAAQAALASNEGGCSKTKAAQAALASNEGGCSKTKAAKAGDSGCCAKKGQAATASNESGCSKSKAAEATLASNGSGCSKSAKAANSGSCDKKAGATLASAKGAGCSKSLMAANGCADKKGSDCKQLKAGRVKLAGTVHCGSCDLGLTSACATVLKTADGSLVQLKGSMADALKKEAAHGSKLVKLRGRADSEGLVTVSRYELAGDATEAVGM